jgi:hypothetical protein
MSQNHSNNWSQVINDLLLKDEVNFWGLNIRKLERVLDLDRLPSAGEEREPAFNVRRAGVDMEACKRLVLSNSCFAIFGFCAKDPDENVVESLIVEPVYMCVCVCV